MSEYDREREKTSVYLHKLCEGEGVVLGEAAVGREQSSHHLQTHTHTALHALNGCTHREGGGRTAVMSPSFKS